VRGALGAAFLREARLSFLRSDLSVTFLVFAIFVSSLFLKSCLYILSSWANFSTSFFMP
jgi:hypothetical protein